MFAVLVVTNTTSHYIGNIVFMSEIENMPTSQNFDFISGKL